MNCNITLWKCFYSSLALVRKRFLLLVFLACFVVSSIFELILTVLTPSLTLVQTQLVVITMSSFVFTLIFAGIYGVVLTLHQKLKRTEDERLNLSILNTKLSESVIKSRFMVDLSEAVNQSDNQDSFCDLVVKIMEDSLGGKNSFLLLLNTKDQPQKFFGSRVWMAHQNEMVLVLEDLLPKSSIYVVERVSEWCEGLALQELCLTHGVESFVCLSLKKSEQLIGLLWIGFEQTKILSEDERLLCTIALRNIDDVMQKYHQSLTLQVTMDVFEHCAEAIMVTDESDRIVAINPAFLMMSGYERSELIAQFPSLIQWDDQAAELAFSQGLAATGSYRGELWCVRKNAERFAVSLSVSTVYQEQGFRRVTILVDITDKKLAEESIRRHAYFDSLTGLINRTYFRMSLTDQLIECEAESTSFGLMLLDMDQFKEVNDSLGHDAGDTLLVLIAQRLQVFAEGGIKIARLGGDEFVLMVPQMQNDLELELPKLAQRIISSIRLPYRIGEEDFYLTVSAGIAYFPRDATDGKELLRKADQAMYRAKSAGGNRCELFRPAFAEEADLKVKMIRDLRLATIDCKQFMLLYQPIVSLAHGGVEKCEVLLRWNHPVMNLVSPDRFIGIAEEAGLIIPLGQWVLEQAFSQNKIWQKDGTVRLQMSINISFGQFRENAESLVPFVRRMLDAYQLSGDQIILEITEGLLLDSEKNIQKSFFQLNQMGIQIALDDFGTGYSGLVYLQHFHIDYIKIDRSFINRLGDDTSNVALCEAMITMAHKLGIKVIAEGVETNDQKRILGQLDCDYAQGYLFSEPLPADVFAKRWF